ncbi:MAG: hypothetical protein KF778_18295 [Rhodocyclaceae bacterium]|nr:hypothetical protein [Rhodocyclaceae bacterium]
MATESLALQSPGLRPAPAADYVEALKRKRDNGQRLTQREQQTLATYEALFDESQPVPNNARGLRPGQEDDPGAMVRLALNEVKPYEHNPRQRENDEFHAIKAWLAETRRTLVLAVTRRPGEQIYTLAEGAGTRYRAVQELYDETREECFRWILGVYAPWKGEAQVLIAHLGENVQRSALTFWDLASGVARAKLQLDAELGGKPLTLRAFEAELGKRGLKVHMSTLSAALFAATRLGVLGQAAAALTLNDTRVLQPGINSLLGLSKRLGISDERAWSDLIVPALDEFRIRYEQALADCADKEHRPPVPADALVAACRAAISAETGYPTAALDKMLRLVADNPTIAPDDLLRAVKPVPAPPAAVSAETGGDARPGQSARAGTEQPAAAQATAPAAAVSLHQPAPSLATPAGPALEPDAQARAAGAADGVPAIANAALSETCTAATALARTAGLSVIPCPAMPLGYWVEFDGRPRGQHAQCVWWMLAAVSGQLLPEWRSTVPATSGWGRILATADEFDGEDLLELLRESVGVEANACDIWSGLIASPHGAPALQFFINAQQAWAARADRARLLTQASLLRGRDARHAG